MWISDIYAKWLLHEVIYWFYNNVISANITFWLLQWNPVFCCEQNYNIAMQCCNIDVQCCNIDVLGCNLIFGRFFIQIWCVIVNKLCVPTLHCSIAILLAKQNTGFHCNILRLDNINMINITLNCLRKGPSPQEEINNTCLPLSGHSMHI